MKKEIENEICITGKFDIKTLTKISPLKNYTPTKKNLKSIYFDDLDYNLFKNKIGLRLREINGNWEQTLKLELTGTKRIEWNKKFANKNLIKINRDYLPDKKTLEKNYNINFNYAKTMNELKKKFYVDVERTSWVFDYLDGKLELSFDLGKIINGVNEKKISEIDIELVQGEPSIIWTFAIDFLKILPLSSLEIRTKVLRGILLDKENHYLLSDLKKNNVTSDDPISTLISEHKNLTFFFSMFIDHKEYFDKKVFIHSLMKIRNILYHLKTSDKKKIFLRDNKLILDGIVHCDYFLSTLTSHFIFFNKKNKKKLYYFFLLIGLISSKI